MGSSPFLSRRAAAGISSPAVWGCERSGHHGRWGHRLRPDRFELQWRAWDERALPSASNSNQLLKRDPDAVLSIGDAQYACGGYQAFLRSYDKSWGRVKAITYPAVGNHEYDSSGGTDCSTGAEGYFKYFGGMAGSQGKGYYSFDLGAWHLIALNSQCSHVGGCDAGSAQELWLKADLVLHPGDCTLAFWHEPRWGTKTSTDNGALDVLWEDLADAHADIVLNGHIHTYARFTPLNRDGHASSTGMREFIVGTGGDDAFAPASRSIIERGGGDFGLLRLVLHPHSYGWRFLHAAGENFTDSGTGSCH